MAKEINLKLLAEKLPWIKIGPGVGGMQQQSYSIIMKDQTTD